MAISPGKPESNLHLRHAPAADPPTGRARRRAPRPGLILALVSLAIFMVVLDFSILSVALPSIRSDLGLSLTMLQWTSTGYALTFGGFLLFGGRAADVFGRGRVFAGGMAVFTLASALAGFSDSGTLLVLARILQGLGAALGAPSALSIITTTFTVPAERNRALGIFGAIATSGFCIGMVLGGVITSYLGWRWNFLINIPVGGIVLGSSFLLLAGADEWRPEKGFDFLGALLATSGVSLLVFGLTRVEDYGWLSPATVAYFASGLAVLVLFHQAMRRVERPLIPPWVFKSRPLLRSNAIMILVEAVNPGSMVLMILYMQSAMEFTPLQAGLAFFPAGALMMAGAVAVPKCIEAMGRSRVLLLGTSLMALSQILLIQLPDRGTYLISLMPSILIQGIGIPFCVLPLMIASSESLPGEDQGLASGLIQTSQQMGAALGIALLIAVAQPPPMHLQPADLAGGMGSGIPGLRTAFQVSSALGILGIFLAYLDTRAKART